MKTINIKVIPNAKKNNVSEEEGEFKIHVKAPALDGKANKEAVELLADFLKIKKRDINIIKGEKSRMKIIQISQ